MSYKIEIEFSEDLRLVRWEFSTELIELLKVNPEVTLEINTGPLLTKLKARGNTPSESIQNTDEHEIH